MFSDTLGIMNNKKRSKLWTLQLKTCADVVEEPKEKKTLALNAGKQVAASHPQHNSSYNTPIFKRRLFNSNTTFIFTAGCHRQTGVWNMYASHMQTHYNVLESCHLFMISHLVCGTVSTIQSRANIFFHMYQNNSGLSIYLYTQALSPPTLSFLLRSML